jgi:hypothetical protein
VRASGCSTQAASGNRADGDSRAAWLLDTDGWRAIWHRTAYDIGGAARRFGLHGFLTRWPTAFNAVR